MVKKQALTCNIVKSYWGCSMRFLKLYMWKLSRIQSFFKNVTKQELKGPLDICVCNIPLYILFWLLNILNKKLLVCL